MTGSKIQLLFFGVTILFDCSTLLCSCTFSIPTEVLDNCRTRGTKNVTMGCATYYAAVHNYLLVTVMLIKMTGSKIQLLFFGVTILFDCSTLLCSCTFSIPTEVLDNCRTRGTKNVSMNSHKFRSGTQICISKIYASTQ